MLSQEETLELVSRAQKGDEEAKTMLVEGNSPLIKSVVRWFRDKGIENDDLFQLGCIGFLKAVDRFDVSFNVKFSTYVVPMVVGEIKRFMRDDGAIKVSRALKSQNLKINKFVDAFFSQNGRTASIAEIAEHFKMTETDVVLAMDSAKMPVSIFANNDEDDGVCVVDKFTEQNEDELFEKVALKEVISSLDKRDRAIILMRYFDDRTQSEIAERLGVSQVQVSRLENKILETLRKKLGD